MNGRNSHRPNINAGVLPIALKGSSALGDFDRMLVFLDTLNIFWKGMEKFKLFIIVRSDELNYVKSNCPSFSNIALEFINEELLISGKAHLLGGWWKQQVIKLMAGKLLFEDYFITFDADTLVTNFFDEHTFLSINESKVVPSMEDTAHHDWWHNCADIFDLPLPKIGFNVTPNILNGSVIKEIFGYFESIYGINLTDKLSDIVLENKNPNFFPWTEYSIFTLLGNVSCDMAYYYDYEGRSDKPIRSTINVWGGKNISDLDDFIKSQDGIFLTIQSTSKIDADMRKLIASRLIFNSSGHNK
ncbi:hypothetical protein G6644_08600 [Polynucleobacter paneuropaeus]|nr:hypothetical protein [Polynucleobacter paneuropaeus]MBT8638555.1 hypothetical protein [Polynucleobacter paneuropaeus]